MLRAGRRRLPAVIVFCSLGLFACGARSVIDTPPASGSGHARLASQVRWRACGARLQCARVRVPLDWAHPRGATISLAVIRYLATDEARRIGSMFVNGGGATGSVELVRSEGAKLDALGRGRFDVVGWALRGGAGSEPRVRCFASQHSRARFWDPPSIPTTPSQSRAYLLKTVRYARRCGALSRRLLAHVSTTDDARDLDYLRRIVRDRKLTYWAVSYGTFLGQTYANLFPGRVRAMALDGLVDPRVVIAGAAARFSNTIAGMGRGLRAFESRCQRAGPERCALAGRGPVAPRVARLLARLRRTPIPAPGATPPGPLSVGDLSAVLFATLADPAAWPRLAQDLQSAITGNGSRLATLARAVLAGTRSAAGDSQAAITCTDSPARQGPQTWPAVIARLSRVSPWAGPFVGWSNWAPCASWRAHAADRYTGPWSARTRNPILVIGTTFDPASPYANARRVARLLPNAVLLTHDGYGHTSEADPSQCVNRLTSAYLVDLEAPKRGTVCRSDRPPFDPHFGEPPRR
jgi:pimeloyl-ACP methyl ester carboxylesterase